MSGTLSTVDEQLAHEDALFEVVDMLTQLRSEVDP